MLSGRSVSSDQLLGGSLLRVAIVEGPLSLSDPVMKAMGYTVERPYALRNFS